VTPEVSFAAASRLTGLRGLLLMSDGNDAGFAAHRAIVQMKKMLLNMEAWFDKAVAYAKVRSFDPEVLLGARLAPDQLPLVRQVQSACDRAKFAGARLAGKEAPRHPDDEKTMDELRARIRVCAAYLDTFVAEDFRGASTRIVELPFFDDKTIEGSDYLIELGQPGFYFHVTTAYSILRHNGVDLTMRDFIGAANVRSPERASSGSITARGAG
jgi:hypothetical protein